MTNHPSDTWLLFVILGMGFITYAIRVSLILLIGRINFPELVRQALSFVPAAVLSAIIIPELVLPAGDQNVSLANARLLAGVLAAVVAWRTRSVLATIGAGMVALWILQAILP